METRWVKSTGMRDDGSVLLGEWLTTEPAARRYQVDRHPHRLAT